MVAISSKQKTMADYTGEEIYCICKSTDISRFMIGCDACDEWFHGDCINLQPDEANNIESFYCRSCIKKNPSLKVVYKASYKKEKKSHKSEKKDREREREKHHKHKDKHREREREREREPRREDKHKKPKPASNFEDFLKKIKSDKSVVQKQRERELKKTTVVKDKKHSSRRCGYCEGCRKFEDCGKCDHCKDMKKFGGLGLQKHRCRLRYCKVFHGASKEKTPPPPPPPSSSRVDSPLPKPKLSPPSPKLKERPPTPKLDINVPPPPAPSLGRIPKKKPKTDIPTEEKRKPVSPPSKPKVEFKEPKLEPKQEPKLEPKQEPKFEPKIEPKKELTPETNPEPKPFSKPFLKSDIDTDSDNNSDNKDDDDSAVPEFPFRASPEPEKRPKMVADEDSDSGSDSDWKSPAPKKARGKKPARKVRKKGRAQKRTYTKKKKEIYSYEEYTNPMNAYTAHATRNLMSLGADIDDSEPRQCYGPGCTEPARQGSKYCSDDCGLKLATIRIFNILPERIQNWHSSPCQAEEADKIALEKVRQDQLAAKQKVEDLDRKQKQLTEFIAKVKQYEIAEATDSQEEETDSEMTVFCVTCGHEVGQKTALKHMEKCFQKYESLTAFGSPYLSHIGGNILCDAYNTSSNTYCKRLKVICPEHSKEAKAASDEVCGCPLQSKQFKDTGEVCRTAKKKCNKHPCWERMRRAEIDLERLRQWKKLEELLEQERSIRTAMSNRAGVLSLMLHRTIDHDAMKPILKSAN